MKNRIDIILSKLKKPSKDHEEDHEFEDEEEDGLSVAADEILDAISASDPQALKEALKSFFEQC